MLLSFSHSNRQVPNRPTDLYWWEIKAPLAGVTALLKGPFTADVTYFPFNEFPMKKANRSLKCLVFLCQLPIKTIK